MKMEDLTLILMTVGMVALVALGLYWYYRSKNGIKARKIGRKGEKYVAKKLNGIARKEHWTVLHDIYLPLYDNTTQIDHLVVGSFGILSVETKALNGEIYGTAKDEAWVQIIGQNRNKHNNPVMQNEGHINCIKHILRTHDIYSVPVDGVVVFSSSKVQLFLERKMPVIKLKALKSYLRRYRSKDNHVNVDQVVKTLKEVQVTDAKKIRSHVKNLKKMQKKVQKKDR